jgi:hypothetical protein
MWHLIISLIVCLIIGVKNGLREKRYLYYMACALVFPSIGYSIWRANSKDASTRERILTLSLNFSIVNTALVASRVIQDMYLKDTFNFNDCSMLISAWLVSTTFSLGMGLLINGIEQNKVKKNANKIYTNA